MSATLASGLTSPLLDSAMVTIAEGGIAVGGWRTDLASHRARWGQRIDRRGPLGSALHHQVADIGLTGRGGGHFPVATKWAPAIAAGPGGTVVVNAAEGEPASAKDSVLWQYRPHLVLDGAVALADVIGARDMVLWLHADADATRVSMEQAIAERREAGEQDPPIRILLAPPGYVSGESSAVIAGVRGEPVAPIFVADPARPWGEGPAILVHNTETVARVGLLSSTGAQHYPTSSLITLAEMNEGKITRRTVVEAEPGETLLDLLQRAGRPLPGAFLLGGYAGSWHAGDQAVRMPMDPLALRERGLSLGAGIVITVADSRDMITQARQIADYLAGETAGQCGPCQFGMPALVRAFAKGRFAQTEEIASLVAGRGGCRMPDGAIRMVRSAMALQREFDAGSVSPTRGRSA